jgi:hypothetical protein
MHPCSLVGSPNFTYRVWANRKYARIRSLTVRPGSAGPDGAVTGGRTLRVRVHSAIRAAYFS